MKNKTIHSAFKVAIVHDWLVTDAGAEKVLRALIELYPDAQIYTLVDFLTPKERQSIIGGRFAHTSFIQRLPFAKKYFRHYLFLFAWAIERFELKEYDLVISSSWAVAKGAKTHKHQKHICYCHTPIRYAWDLYDDYTKDLYWLKKFLVSRTLKSLRKFDLETSKRVDFFIANSEFVQERIKRIYKRESLVIYPPVDIHSFTLVEEKEDFFLTASRLVPYKKTRLIVEAFNEMPEKTLVVIGEGEELELLSNIAQENVKIMGYQEKEVLIDMMQKAKAFVYAAVEDFGIVPIEAMACGTPVIALNDGGTAETVIAGFNGVHFERQERESIQDALTSFETMHFDSKSISRYARKFSTQSFKDKFRRTQEESSIISYGKNKT